MPMEFLSLYSPFLNSAEEFFSAWRLKVYYCQPHTQRTLLAAMDATCDDITADTQRFFPFRCLWPNRQECLHCNSYSTACTVSPKEIVLYSHLYSCFFLCAIVLSFPGKTGGLPGHPGKDLLANWTLWSVLV